jgi:3-methylfumaryl-CoA hydratase
MDAAWTVETPVTLLFRFSALTYNGHRIHYDRDYARDVEGYPGLVVHGPLQAMLMAEAVRRQQPVTHRGTRFTYRLVAPVFEDEGLVVSTTTTDPDPTLPAPPPSPRLLTTVRSRDGRTTATGTYEPGPVPGP